MRGIQNLRQLPCTTILAVIAALPPDSHAEPAGPISQLIEEHCFECHDSDAKKGNLDLERLIAGFDPERDVANWVKIESAITRLEMPPQKKEPLAEHELMTFTHWFENTFVLPDGIQRAGASHARRLTREELQNSLEDILHIDLRETVTNSRLHVIPDSIIEKFFAAGVHGESGFSNDALTLSKESIDIDSYARCVSLVLSQVFTNADAMLQLFGSATLSEEIAQSEARLMIDKFGRSAFRRPLTTAESNSFLGVFNKMAADRPASDALRSSMLAILLSPSFIYRFEEPTTEDTPVAATNRELAVRLSYFLWSSPPDRVLLRLAENGDLHQPEILRQQVRRMLADPKRIALAENLGGEWFGYKKLRKQSLVDSFNDKLSGFYRTQYEEALLFFDSIVRYDQPITRLVDADWAYLNAHQASIYRLELGDKSFTDNTSLPPINLHYRSKSRQVEQGDYELKHDALTLVGLSDTNRGGFVTLGPTLSATSTLNRTSPIRRGVWVMERILGQHFEQPENVPDLEETQKKAKNLNKVLTHDEILKMHSSQESCVSCHKSIDPIGFGLSEFDHMGISASLTGPNPLGETLHWTPEQTPKTYADREWQLERPLAAGAEVRIFFKWTHGANRLDIREVRLESGDLKLVDDHIGYAGTLSHENVWVIKLPDDAPLADWKLIAEISGNGGTDSNGIITVSLPTDKPPAQALPNGKEFGSPSELKRLLLSDYHDQIIDNAVRRVLGYALGRATKPIDRPAIEEIKASIQAQDYRMTALLEAVVLSYPFTHKENP